MHAELSYPLCIMKKTNSKARQRGPTGGISRPRATPGPLLVQRAIPVQTRAKISVEAILNAARRILDDVGVEGFNTNVVAKLARVRIRTVYRYFPNKYSILVALTERMVSQWDAWMDEQFSALAKSGADWESQQRRMIELYVKEVSAQPGAISIIKTLGVITQLRRLDTMLLERMVEKMAVALRDRGVKLPAAQLRVICRTQIVSVNSGVENYFRVSPPERQAHLKELANLSIAYLRLYL